MPTPGHPEGGRVSVFLHLAHVEDTVLRGWDRFVDIGPALILAGSLFVGYVYAWKRALFHVLVCLALAAGTICLGW